MRKLLLLIFAHSLLSLSLMAQDASKEEPKKKPISAMINLNTMFKTGDVEARDITGEILLQAVTGKVQHTAIYDYKNLRQQQGNQEVDYLVHYLRFQTNVPIVNRLQGIVGLEFEENDIRVIETRWLGYAGVMASLFKTEKVQLSLTTAGGYADIQFGSALGDLSEDFAIWYVGNKFTWEISPTLQFENSNSLFTEFTDETELRWLGDTTLKSSINGFLSLVLNFEYDYSSRTDFLGGAAQTETVNTTFTAGIQAKF